MTISPFEDCVAIDTNVFEHLLNPQMNSESHISELLIHLQERGITLIVDDNSRISNEYDNRLSATLSNSNYTSNEIYIMRYWIRHAARREVTVDSSDGLMRAIRMEIPGNSEGVDRIFVYAAFSLGKILVSNDETHIVIGPPGERGQRPRRDRLLRSTRRLRPTGADILTSQESHGRI